MKKQRATRNVTKINTGIDPLSAGDRGGCVPTEVRTTPRQFSLGGLFTRGHSAAAVRKSFHVVAALVSFAACRTTDGNTGDDAPADAAPDGVDGVGCSALTPRTVPLEAFVGPTGLQTRMTTLIDSAKTTLDVQMYLFTVKPLADRIVAAKQRGVAVRVILDPDEPGNAAVEPILMAGGVTFRQATPLYTYSHAKYLIVDRSSVAIMSMNFNVDAMSNERNHGVIDKDPEDVSDVQAIFDMDWAAAGNEAPKAADLTCTRLIVSPNNSRQRIIEHINSAKTTLELELMYLSETTVRNAVGQAKMRGVNVRVILEDPHRRVGHVPDRARDSGEVSAELDLLAREADRRRWDRVRRVGEHVDHLVVEEPRARCAGARAGPAGSDQDVVRVGLDRVAHAVVPRWHAAEEDATVFRAVARARGLARRLRERTAMRRIAIPLLLLLLPAVASADPEVKEIVDEDMYKCKDGAASVAMTFKPEMEVRELVTWGMALTCKTFMLEPRTVPIGRKVTLIAPARMTKPEAYQMFLAALATAGLTVVPKGKAFKIVDAPTARANALPIFSKTLPDDTDQVVRFVVRPTYTKPETLVKAFSAIKSDAGDIQVIGSLVLVTDYGSHVRSMMSLKKLVDVAEGTDAIYTLPVMHADATKLEAEVESILGLTAAGPAGKGAEAAPAANLAVPTKMLVDTRTNTLVIAASEAAYQRVAALVERLDISLDIEGGASIHVYRLSHAIAVDLAAVLTQTVTGQKPAAQPAPGATASPASGPDAPRLDGEGAGDRREGIELADRDVERPRLLRDPRHHPPARRAAPPGLHRGRDRRGPALRRSRDGRQRARLPSRQRRQRPARRRADGGRRQLARRGHARRGDRPRHRRAVERHHDADGHHDLVVRLAVHRARHEDELERARPAKHDRGR